MNRQIDFAEEKRALNFLRENALRAEIDDRRVAVDVAFRVDFDDFNGDAVRFQSVAGPIRLPKRERARSGSQSQRFHNVCFNGFSAVK